jgi:hypothetical protein
MSGQDFVEQLGELVRTAADGVSVERSMALARMMSVHYRPWHHRAGRALEDHMALRDLERRLDRLDAGSAPASIAAALEAARRRAQAWRASGNSGSPPPEPLAPPPDGATRAERERWRELAHGRARLLSMDGTEEGLARLRELYAMPDAELLQALNRAGTRP